LISDLGFGMLGVVRGLIGGPDHQVNNRASKSKKLTEISKKFQERKGKERKGNSGHFDIFTYFSIPFIS
jgi:hypothetical protein